MKKILLFTLFSCFAFAQNPELFSNNWYISQIVMNGQTTTTPTIANSVGSSKFTQSTPSPQNIYDYTFISYYYNTAGNNISFSPTQNRFIKNSSACTLGQYVGINQAAVQDFDQKHCDFFVGILPPGDVPIGTIFNYEILNSGNLKTLIITNSTTGNKVFYNNTFLGTKENVIKKTFKLYPNPSTDFVIIENVEKNLKLKINDLSGKILFETLTSDKTLKIDVSSFATGQYILSIENFKPEIFIKK
ncbi:T9SS type A sorting domain-containing protein [Chryseobacterium indoltheticum]|uniref:T9SS C-terminal target domain-containing protein n=1 Tax=Chryseobacterium indoltheticum TaxID=254 RepID=A0A3G6N4S5_9FLAO|nr:T9SS type A sorting domain-containing protein [Chryseobacterium indoltheticum]AZA59973.1 T9SS C-terminal target domain-containing protein [Chryseobacterium indoltheticum]